MIPLVPHRPAQGPSSNPAAECRAPLPGGGWLAVTATPYPLGHENLAPLKIATDPALAALPQLRFALHTAVMSARMAEPAEDTRLRVEIAVHRSGPAAPLAGQATPTEVQALAEFAAVVADRAARGLLAPSPTGWVAVGASDDWVEGRIDALPSACRSACLQSLLACPDLGEATVLLAADDTAPAAPLDDIAHRHPSASVREVRSLRSFSGAIEPGAGPRRQCVSFPLIGGDQQGDRMAELSVVVRRAAAGRDGALDFTGFPAGRRAVEDVLRLVRRHDPHAARWDTLVSLPVVPMQGQSFELALAVADRIARGRDFAGRGRVIATGALDRDGGQVLPVDGLERKCALIERAALAWDTVLLPAEWRGRARLDFTDLTGVREPAVVFVERVAWAEREGR